MSGDKKVVSDKAGDKIGFILTRGIGQAFQTYDVDKQEVIDVIQESMK